MWHDWREFFATGCLALDTGREKVRKKPEDDDEAARECPACQCLHAPAPFCPNCGHEYPRRRGPVHVPGELVALLERNDPGELRREIWPQVVHYVLSKGRTGDAAQRMAQAIYMNITGSFARARVENTQPQPLSREVGRRIKAEQMRYLYAKRGATAIEERQQRAHLAAIAAEGADATSTA